jgi:uncharacterized PurR-regulated membrane protein YhhQ (DUF165 family)
MSKRFLRQSALNKPIPKTGLLQMITNFVLGFFGGMILFMLCLRILPSMWGAFLGVGANVVACAYMLRWFGKDKAKRIAVYGVIASIAAVIVIYLLLTALVFSMFSEIAG